MQTARTIVGYSTNYTSPLIAEQWIQIADWAASNGYRLRGLFADLSAEASASHTDLHKAVNLALETKSMFVVYSLENLTTSSAKVIKLMRIFLESDVAFMSLNDQFDTSGTSVTDLSRAIYALDNLNRILNENRFRELSLSLRFMENVPYGMMMDVSDKLVPNNYEMSVVETIIDLRRAGRSYRFIANKLTELKIHTRRRARWHPKVVMSIYNRYEHDHMKEVTKEKKRNEKSRLKGLSTKEKIKVAAFEKLREHLNLKFMNTEKANEFLSGINILWEQC